jgi:hypothetical protein
LQYTLDRSVLAAASVTQPLNPVDVVENYFEISGLQNYRLTVDVEEGLNFRRVEAYAELEINTLLHAHVRRPRPDLARPKAPPRTHPQRRSVHVLDISGSMGSANSKMTNMQPRRARFRDRPMLQANETTRQSRVDLDHSLQRHGQSGRALGERLHALDEHTESSCVRFSMSSSPAPISTGDRDRAHRALGFRRLLPVRRLRLALLPDRPVRRDPALRA